MGKPKKNTGRIEPFEITIYGQPYSKANSRRLVSVGGKPRLIKSAPALRYVEDFQWQCPVLNPLFEDDVRAEIDIYYASRRPDVDESVILDCLQGRVIRNDRLVREKLVRGFVDNGNPRAVIRISRLAQAEAGTDHIGG